MSGTLQDPWFRAISTNNAMCLDGLRVQSVVVVTFRRANGGLAVADTCALAIALVGSDGV